MVRIASKIVFRIILTRTAGLADFATYQRDERGLSTATIRNQGWHVEKFMGWLDERNHSFGDVSLEDIDAFLANNGKQGWGSVSVASIAAGIDGPRLFRHEGLAVGPSWPDVRRLIASTEGDSARDIRDRGILMLLATYGFRSGEVAGLCLKDLNWESELLSITRPKSRRVQQYPLRRETGDAILRYLENGRPLCAEREVFLTLKVPYRPL